MDGIYLHMIMHILINVNGLIYLLRGSSHSKKSHILLVTLNNIFQADEHKRLLKYNCFPNIYCYTQQLNITLISQTDKLGI